ncbi:MAG TPA: hypothetical protein PJ986_03855 [Gammaproteobacteria bacterium]|nr:hypothetical protein [Gammaproteobacteria bacterium]
MACREHEYVPKIHSILRRALSLALICAALSAQATERLPFEVIVRPDAVPAPYASAMNEEGVIEANSVRIDDGVVHLEYKAAPGTSYDALTAVAR